MNYELAKKLKDGGFPQEGKGNYIDGEDCDVCGNHVYYVPTLSELIEACGDRFWKLIKSYTYNKWSAITSEDTQIVVLGKTPEEAVANLWLELNKK